MKLYRDRDSVLSFDDMNRLRVHSSGNARSRLFIQYIASILLYSCRNNLGLYDSTNSSLRNILEDLSGIFEVRHNNKRGSLITEYTLKQKELITQIACNAVS